jgi:TetR/AcrR family transcriptional regulator, cholesterol catabolism regulator
MCYMPNYPTRSGHNIAALGDAGVPRTKKDTMPLPRPAMTPLPGRRERNKLRIRERVYHAAVELFIEKGYDRTTIEEITEKADVARGTFFNHFQSKEDLISAWGEYRRQELMGFLGEINVRDDASTLQLKRCMDLLGRLNENERDETVAMLTAWVRAGRPILEEPYVASIFIEIISAAIERGEFGVHVPPELAGMVLRDAYLGALYRWIHDLPGQEQGSLTRELGEILQLFVEGMAAHGPSCG